MRNVNDSMIEYMRKKKTFHDYSYNFVYLFHLCFLKFDLIQIVNWHAVPFIEINMVFKSFDTFLKFLDADKQGLSFVRWVNVHAAFDRKFWWFQMELMNSWQNWLDWRTAECFAWWWWFDSVDGWVQWMWKPLKFVTTKSESKSCFNQWQWVLCILNTFHVLPECISSKRYAIDIYLERWFYQYQHCAVLWKHRYPFLSVPDC